MRESIILVRAVPERLLRASEFTCSPVGPIFQSTRFIARSRPPQSSASLFIPDAQSRKERFLTAHATMIIYRATRFTDLRDEYSDNELQCTRLRTFSAGGGREIRALYISPSVLATFPRNTVFALAVRRGGVASLYPMYRANGKPYGDLWDLHIHVRVCIHSCARLFSSIARATPWLLYNPPSSRDLLLDIEKVAFAAGNSVYNPLPMRRVDSSRSNNRPPGNMQSVVRETSTFTESRSPSSHVLALIPTTMGWSRDLRSPALYSSSKRLLCKHLEMILPEKRSSSGIVSSTYAESIFSSTESSMKLPERKQKTLYEKARRHVTVVSTFYTCHGSLSLSPRVPCPAKDACSFIRFMRLIPYDGCCIFI